jgi:hypothetical protein
MSDSELRKFFEFNESDLNANRSGQLSPKQKKTLEENEKGGDQILIGFGVIIALIGLALIFWNGRNVLEDWISFPHDLVSLLVGVLLPLGLCGFFSIGAFRIAFSKNDNTVQKAEGKVKLVKVEKKIEDSTSDAFRYKTVEQYELRVGGVNFENVDEDLLNIIDDGDVYAFYYTKGTKQILSAEQMKKGK